VQDPAVVVVDQELFEYKGAKMLLLLRCFTEIRRVQLDHDVGNRKARRAQTQGLFAPFAMLVATAVVDTGVGLGRQDAAVPAKPANLAKRSAWVGAHFLYRMAQLLRLGGGQGFRRRAGEQ